MIVGDLHLEQLEVSCLGDLRLVRRWRVVDVLDSLLAVHGMLGDSQATVWVAQYSHCICWAVPGSQGRPAQTLGMGWEWSRMSERGSNNSRWDRPSGVYCHRLGVGRASQRLANRCMIVQLSNNWDEAVGWLGHNHMTRAWSLGTPLLG